MLVGLHVKNLALIEESEVFFENGLNILTGETGAGKSIILGSIHLALGAKADKDLIRNGAEYALIELIFSSEKPEIRTKLGEFEIPSQEDNSIVIQRRIMPGRSVCKINGETITGKQLKEIASMLIDIHGQNDTQTLLNVKKFSEILDDYAGPEFEEQKKKYQTQYRVYKKVTAELEKAKNQEKDFSKELSLTEFELNEISSARLQAGEDEELEESYRRMNHSKKIAEGIARIYQMTAADEDAETGASQLTDRALREMKVISDFDIPLKEMEETLATIDSMLNDFNHAILDYQENLNFTPQEFAQTEERLNLINHLKSKYGDSIDQIMQYEQQLQVRLDQMNHFDSYMEELNQKNKKVYQETVTLAQHLSELRSSAAEELSHALTDSLLELNFSTVHFSIPVLQDLSKMSEEGIDDIQFLISLNPGEPKKPLQMVASGGERSRIMLALKTIMADREKTETLIFDEIDTGISGKTAWKVSEKMALLGKRHQLICITHLPQIAAMADTHFVIDKQVKDNVSITDIRRMTEEEGILEIARLLGTENITSTVLANAKELKELANHTKRY